MKKLFRIYSLVTGFLIKNLFYKNINKILLFLNDANYDRTIKINGIIGIKNLGRIELGKDVIINSGISFNPIGGDNRTHFWTGKNGMIKIGYKVGISNSSFVSFRSITIGNNVLIGGGCKIYDTDFHSINASDRIIGREVKSTVSSKPVLISDGVFIGGHSIILKGVIIGKNSVVGAGSVVTKNIPPNQIWAGNPAKFIKKI